MNNALAHPGICDRFGRFLSQVNLTVCVRVCKAWQKSFIPLLWHTFHLRLCYHYPEQAQSISKHAHYVHKMIADIPPFQDIIAKSPIFVFPQLTSLLIEKNHSYYVDNEDLEPFMKRHGHTLKHLSIGPFYDGGQMGFEWMAHCTALQSFYLGGEGIQSNKFWKICIGAWMSSQLQELELDDVYLSWESFSPWEDDKEKAQFLSRGAKMGIRRFTLKKVHSFKLESCLTFLKMCPELRHIGLEQVSSTLDSSSMEQFAQCLRESHWPYLMSFSLCHESGSTIAQIIESRGNKGLTELDLRDSGFYDSTWNTILEYPRLVAILETLYLVNCSYVKSNMVHKILASLPNLKRFSAPVIHDGDVYEGIDSHRWVCLGLEILRVNIRVYGGVEGHAAFHRKLALLTNLEQLWTSSNYDHHNGLCFRLEMGLDNLGWIGRNLKSINFAKPDSLSDADVSWMATHWPRLEEAPKQVLDAYNRKRWRI